jgi:hypothetical protein
MAATANTDVGQLRGVKDRFVGAFVRPNSGIAAVTVRAGAGRPHVVVTVREDMPPDLPDSFCGLPVHIQHGHPGQVAIGSRHSAR